MKRSYPHQMALAAFAILALEATAPAPAKADTIIGYTVDGTYNGTGVGSGTVTGTFDVDTSDFDVTTSSYPVTSVDLTVTASGGVNAFTFTNTQFFNYYIYAQPSFYNLDANDGGNQLDLGFYQGNEALVSSGFGSSYVGDDFGRFYAISGTITEGSGITSSAPEPSAWALMIAGIGGVGLMLRGTRGMSNFRFRRAFAT